MRDHKETIEKLFAKYLAGKCSREEIETLLGYFGSAEQEETLSGLIRQELDAKVTEHEEHPEAVREVYRSLLTGIKGKASPRPALSFTAWKRAAVWLLLIGSLGALLFLHRMQPGTGDRFSHQEIVTRSGERKKVVLDDGSVVWLNAASKLQYPERFTGNTREVTLEGEAYFEVARKPGSPFLIRSGALKTKVLGTSFNIRAYKEDKTISVAVLTGKVAVASPEDELQLTPDQQAIFDKEDQHMIRKEGVLASGLIGWREGKISFRNSSFADVTATLQRSHNVRISYDPRLENCPVVYADFDETEPIRKILEMLLASVDGHVIEKENGGIYLSGKGCTL